MFCPYCGKEMKHIETSTHEAKYFYCENCKTLFRYHRIRKMLEELW